MALLVFSTSAYAATVHVEVIVFANLSTKDSNGEIFEKPEEIIRIEKTDEIDSELDRAFTNLPVAAERLTEIANALEAHADFEILNYLSWIQEPVPKSRTNPVLLEIDYPNLVFSPRKLLSGEVSLFEVQQQIQFEVNAFYKPLRDVVKDRVSLTDLIVLYAPEFEYHLNERRRVYINEIHYFDHPKFGVIVSLVRP